jgi:hypothetical protein
VESVTVFTEPADLRAHERRRDRELEAARAVVDAARALLGGSDAGAPWRLRDALDAYERALEANRREQGVPEEHRATRPASRPDLSRDYAAAGGGWQRGRPHRIAGRR